LKYYTIHEFSKLVYKTPQTLRNWDRKGRLKPHHTGMNGYRYYSEDQRKKVLHIEDKTEKLIIGYCRVSSPKQKDDLQRQIDNMKTYLLAKGEPFKIISDVGSGINYTKSGLKELINQVNSNKVSKIVILYKDRLIRFGYEIIEYFAKLNSCEIEVIDNTEKTEEQELVEDLIQIVTVFSCRLQGKRANKAKKLVKELLENDKDNKS
jgi:putative resolvase